MKNRVVLGVIDAYQDDKRNLLMGIAGCTDMLKTLLLNTCLTYPDVESVVHAVSKKLKENN